MSLLYRTDGLAVVEDVYGIARVQACMPPHVPVPKPGPCKGHRRGVPRPRAKDTGKTGKTKAVPAARRKRQELVERAVVDAASTLATHLTQTRPGGAWRAERDAVHRDIANALYAKAAGVPNEGKAVIAGGLGGAGKTTVLREHAGIDPSQYLTINPDDIKEELAKRDLIPQVPGGEKLSPMERVALVHAESKRIAQLLADKAYQDRKNLIWDITMSSGSAVTSRVNALREHGYDVRGVFVDIPVETSVRRALDRWWQGVQDWKRGDGLGGRYVPPEIIRGQQSSGGHTVNRDVFDVLKPLFDGWSFYDNSVDGRAPQLIDQKG